MFEDDVKLAPWNIFFLKRTYDMLYISYSFFLRLKGIRFSRKGHFKESSTVKLKMMQFGGEFWVITYFQSKFDVKRMNLGRIKNFLREKEPS